MYICLCDAITDKTLKITIKNKNIYKIKDLHKIGLCNNCKKCCKEISRILKNESNNHKRSSV